MLKMLISFLLFLGLWTGPALGNKKVEQHRAFHWIAMKGNQPDPMFGMVKLDASGCTAYAIASHVLLTAQHCDVDGGQLYIDPISNPHEDMSADKSVFIAEKLYDNRDHMLLVVPTVYFNDTVQYDPANYRPAVQGEHVYFWGNPDWLHDMYREGYTMGVVIPPDEDVDAAPKGSLVYIFDMNGNHGDSGSAIFSAKDGRIVSIVTYGLQDGKFIGGYLLQFTSDQVKQAEGLSCQNVVCPAQP